MQKSFGSAYSSAFSTCSQSSSLCLGGIAGFEISVATFKIVLSKYKVLKAAFSFSYRQGFCMSTW